MKYTCTHRPKGPHRLPRYTNAVQYNAKIAFCQVSCTKLNTTITVICSWAHYSAPSWKILIKYQNNLLKHVMDLSHSSSGQVSSSDSSSSESCTASKRMPAAAASAPSFLIESFADFCLV